VIVYRLRYKKTADSWVFSYREPDGHAYFRKDKSSQGVPTIYATEAAAKRALAQVWHGDEKLEIVAYEMKEVPYGRS